MKRKTIILAAVMGLTLSIVFVFWKQKTIRNGLNIISFKNNNSEADLAEKFPTEISPENNLASGKSLAPSDLNRNPADESQSVEVENQYMEGRDIIDIPWALSPAFQERFGNGKPIRKEFRQDRNTGLVYRSFLFEREAKYSLVEIEQIFDPNRSTQEGPLAERAFVADHLIVKLKYPLESPEVQEVLSKLNLTPRGAMNPPFVILHFDRKTSRNSPQRLIRALVESGVVEYAERDAIVVAK